MAEAIIVTGETLAEFQEKNIGLIAPEVKSAEQKEPETKQEDIKPEEKKEEKEVEPQKEEQKTEVKTEAQVEDSEEAETEKETTEEEIKQTPKRLTKLEQKFKKITTDRRNAENELQREREARQASERKVAELEAKLNPNLAIANEDPEPDAAKFTDAIEYAKKLAAWTARKATKEALEQRDKQDALNKEMEQHQKRIEVWENNVKVAKEANEDYEDTIRNSDISVSDEVRDAIIESNRGPEILLHLATHPEEATEINKLSVMKALLKIGNIESKLEQMKENKPIVETKKPTIEIQKPAISKAPEPITPIKGQAISDLPLDGRGEFTGTFDQYKRLRKEGKLK